MWVSEPFRIAFVPGVTPDKWARTWRRRHPDRPLELHLVEESQQRVVLTQGEADMALVRLPVDRQGLHLIPLYEEQPVVVVSTEHPVAAYDEIPLEDLAGEQLVVGDVPGWDELSTADPLPFPDMTAKQAFEVVASGTGIAIVPMSVARLHHRKDLVHRPVLDVPTTRVGLAWLVDNDDERVEVFVGIVRGRRENSSRGAGATPSTREQRRGQTSAGRKQATPGSRRGPRRTPRSGSTRRRRR